MRKGPRHLAGPFFNPKRLVRARRLLNLGAVARPEGVKGARQVDALVGVRAKEVALPLNQGGSEALAAKTVEV